jgi:hypothetical protein
VTATPGVSLAPEGRPIIAQGGKPWVRWGNDPARGVKVEGRSDVQVEHVVGSAQFQPRRKRRQTEGLSLHTGQPFNRIISYAAVFSRAVMDGTALLNSLPSSGESR